MISLQMFLLAINSRYAQHLAGNTLVAISEFLLVSVCFYRQTPYNPWNSWHLPCFFCLFPIIKSSLQDGDWDDFMQLLCICLELAICNILKSSSVGVFGNRYLNFNPSTTSSLKLKLKSANWSVVAAISRVLRNIQKYLKQDFNDECLKLYIDYVSSLLINLPWDLLRESYLDHNSEDLKGSDALLKIEVVQPREITMFFGSFIQLLCSLVALSGSLEAGLGFSPVICRIANLVPKLTPWCHVDLQSPYHVRISHYFRHKVLVIDLNHLTTGSAHALADIICMIDPCCTDKNTCRRMLFLVSSK